MPLKAKTGMIVRSVNRSKDISYKVMYRRAVMIVDISTLTRLEISTKDAGKLKSMAWICYVDVLSNNPYFCPESEFCDGRFEEVPAAGAAKP